MFESKINNGEIAIKGGDSKKSLIGVSLILLALLLFAFLIQPTMNESDSLRVDLENLKQETNALKDQLDRYKKAEAELNLATEVDRIEAKRAIPARMDQDGVIRDVINIAADHDIELNSIGFGKSSSNDSGLTILRVNAGFSGTYTDLVGFLRGLEQSSRYFKVNSISAQISSFEVTSINRVTFSLSIDTFFQN